MNYEKHLTERRKAIFRQVNKLKNEVQYVY